MKKCPVNMPVPKKQTTKESRKYFLVSRPKYCNPCLNPQSSCSDESFTILQNAVYKSLPGGDGSGYSFVKLWTDIEKELASYPDLDYFVLASPDQLRSNQPRSDYCFLCLTKLGVPRREFPHVMFLIMWKKKEGERTSNNSRLGVLGEPGSVRVLREEARSLADRALQMNSVLLLQPSGDLENKA